MFHNNRPKAIDLFAGAGGFTLGALRAGFDVVSAVEIDKYAIETHRTNFPRSTVIDKDISTLSGTELLERSGLIPGQFDCLFGGPPCQGFSTMGKGNVDDSRNSLFSHFFRLVDETSPSLFVAENVPGILADKYSEIVKNALKKVSDKYIVLEPLIVRASNVGVPTIRTRVFFIGYDPNKISKLPNLQEEMKKLSVTTPTVSEALRDIPEPIVFRLDDNKQVWTRLTAQGDPDYLSKINLLVEGYAGDSEALERWASGKETTGCVGTYHKPEIEARFLKTKPGGRDPISTMPKLDPDGLCPTLRAGTDSSRGGFQAVRPIHPFSPRVITPREAARLQGFPDWFLFHPTKWHSFRQIGNSVSPLVAERVINTLIL